MEFIHILIKYRSQLLQALFEHLEISILSVIIAIIIGVPLGIYISKNKKLAKHTLNIVSVFQTIPSLALFGLIIPILGIGIKPSIFVLFLYALLPIIMNTYIGISGVEDFLIESAEGIGMNRRQILHKIKLPIAIPVIMGGVKVATVASIGTATIAALIGAGGFGTFIFRGISINNNQLILMGAIPTAILAIVANYFLGVAEIALTPTKSSVDTSYIKKYKKTILSLVGIIFIIPFLIIINTKYKDYRVKTHTIIVGHKNDTEERILGQIYSQLIKKYTNYNTKIIELGGSKIALEALTKGEIDFYPEYTGTAYAVFFHKNKILSSKGTYEYVKKHLLKDYNLTYLKPLKYNNSYVLLTTPENMKKYNIKNISDLKQYNGLLTIGVSSEFFQRHDGYVGLNKKYGLYFKNTKEMDIGLLYTAIKNRKFDIILGTGTDGRIKAYNLLEIKDDKSFFPPYNVAPILNSKTVKNYPELISIFNKISGKITNNQIQKLNYLVDQKGYTPKEAATKFISEYVK